MVIIVFYKLNENFLGVSCMLEFYKLWENVKEASFI